MYTDPKRVRADIPGTVEGNPVFIYHDAFNPNRAEVEDLKARYRAGKVGDVEVKTKLAAAINAMLEPMRERRAGGARAARLPARRPRRRARARARAVAAGDDGARARRREAAILTVQEPPRPRQSDEPQQLEFESILEDYPVRLQNFEGPLDLLLHLIKKHELNIYDIPIALVTQQYLDYLDLMQELNLDVAGEFLVMAATLIHIKSRMLLPRPDPTQEDPEEDPREALVRRLLEHQRFKAAAELLHETEIQRSAQWGTARRPRRRGGRRGARAGGRGRSVQPDGRVPPGARARAAAAARASCRPSRSRSRRASSSCSRGCRRPRPAASRSCSPTCRRAPA